MWLVHLATIALLSFSTGQAGPTCLDQCKTINDGCTKGCTKIKSSAGLSMCKRNCSDLSHACTGSCREKGRIDGEYMSKHYKPKGAGGGGE